MRALRKKRKRLARLTPREDRCWIFGYSYYLDGGRSESHADKLAWRDLQREFSRLLTYRGCLP